MPPAIQLCPACLVDRLGDVADSYHVRLPSGLTFDSPVPAGDGAAAPDTMLVGHLRELMGTLGAAVPITVEWSAPPCSSDPAVCIDGFAVRLVGEEGVRLAALVRLIPLDEFGEDDDEEVDDDSRSFGPTGRPPGFAD